MATISSPTIQTTPTQTPALVRLRQFRIHRQISIMRRVSPPLSLDRGRTTQPRKTWPPKKLLRQQPPTTLPAASRLTRLISYPPYVPIPGVHRTLKQANRVELVEGTVCRLSMQLAAEGRTWSEIEQHLQRICLECLGRERKLKYTALDVEIIVKRCRELGLTMQMPLDSDSWDLERIEKWWIEETRRTREKSKPVGEDVCGSTGWWAQVGCNKSAL
jgi:hypothetical protein